MVPSPGLLLLSFFCPAVVAVHANGTPVGGTRARRTSFIGNDRVWKSLDEPRAWLQDGRRVESVSCRSTFLCFSFLCVYNNNNSCVFERDENRGSGAAASSSKEKQNTGFSVD